MAEAPRSTLAIVEFLDDIKLHLLYRHEHHLCNPLAGFDLVTF